MTLYDPDDVNQALYKANLQRPRKLIRLKMIGHFRGKPIHWAISDPRGISVERYYSAINSMRKAFPNTLIGTGEEYA